MTAIVLNNRAVPVQTVAPNLSAGEIQLSADRRNTDKQKLSDAERIRRIVLPANAWGEFHAIDNTGNKNQGLSDILRVALKEIGSARLKDSLQENPMLREVPLSDYTITALLSWSEETAASRGSITFTRDAAIEWLRDSATYDALLNKWKDAGADESKIKARSEFLQNRIGALAAKNHGLATEEDATKLLALIKEEDATAGTGSEIVQRLNAIIKSKQAQKKEEAISMDDML